MLVLEGLLESSDLISQVWVADCWRDWRYFLGHLQT